MARLSHSDQQSSATMSGIFAIGCPPERRGPRNVERRQDLRPMHDSRDLDAKKGPPWQDSRAMYPKSPDCTPKRIHGTKILPASARKACISRKRCQGGPLFRAISEKRIHGARILPQQPKQPRRQAQRINRQTERQPKERSWNNSQIAQRQGDTHKTIVLGSPKQRSNQPVTKTIPARVPILAA